MDLPSFVSVQTPVSLANLAANSKPICVGTNNTKQAEPRCSYKSKNIVTGKLANFLNFLYKDGAAKTLSGNSIPIPRC